MSEETLNVGYQTVQMTPITVTAETLQILAKQDKYPDLLALYMAYVEITTWQKTNNVKASTDFMMKRLHWSKPKVRKTKKVLIDLGLVQDITRRKGGEIEGHYILVKHVINPGGGNDYPVDMRPPSTNDLKESTNDLKEKYTSEERKQAQRLHRLYVLHYKYMEDPRSRSAALTEEERQALFDSMLNRYKQTPKRLAVAVARIRDAGPEMCEKAIVNSAKDRWNHGENDREWKADLYEYLLRNYEMVEKWANK